MTIGNPPFGKNASLAISFVNRACEFSDVVAFILPRTFEKTSVQRKLDRHFFLAAQMALDGHSFTFKGESYDVPCVFQIWTHSSVSGSLKSNIVIPAGGLRPLPPILSETVDFIFVVPSSSPDFAIRRIGVNAGRIFVNDPHTCSEQSHLFIRARRKSMAGHVLAQLKALDLEHTSVKFQTAGNPSISKNELCNLYNDHCAQESVQPLE